MIPHGTSRIVRTDESRLALIAEDGNEFFELRDGTWTDEKGLWREGDIRYVGIASHAGHIQLKPMWIYEGCIWRNIVTGEAGREVESNALKMLER